MNLTWAKGMPLPNWWGSKGHKLFTIAVFVTLASLDNAAIGIFPPLYGVMARDLLVSEAALGLVTALRILVTAVAAAFWGYQADRGRRKRLLLYGTLIWSTAIFFSGAAQTFWQLLLSQAVAAVGLGSVSAVGFALVSDFIPPHRRGIALSVWGLAQGFGWGTGSLLSSTLGAYAWPAPFWMVAAAGLGFILLYLFTYEPSRGETEPELAGVFAAGGDYRYQVRAADLWRLARQPVNRWLLLQGFLATLSFGAMIWIPRLFTARVEAAGFGLETATVFGSLLALLFQAGVYFAIPAGHLGDLWQQHNLRGRALLGVIGNLGAAPAHIAFFLWPLHGLIIPAEAGMVPVALAALGSVFTNGWVAGSFALAFLATVLVVLDSPNRAALINDANLPEHRGTVIGLSYLGSGLGLALGNALTGLTFSFLIAHLPSPQNYALGLSLFQLFLIPAGLCYYQAAKTAPQAILTVRTTLAQRGRIGR